MLVWTTFLELDFSYWSKEGLSNLANLLGRPLVTNKATQNKIRIKFARLLIEMDLSQPFPDEITFMGEFDIFMVQIVNYASKPLKCRHCSMFLHLVDDCRKEVQKRMAQKRRVTRPGKK